jgi:hypothetical protein
MGPEHGVSLRCGFTAYFLLISIGFANTENKIPLLL